MQSAFDIQISYMTQILKQSNKDSQYLTLEITQVKTHLQTLQRNIQNKLQAINKEIEPRIQQLQNRIQMYWAGVKEMDQQAWKQLDEEERIFNNCKEIVNELEKRTTDVYEKI